MKYNTTFLQQLQQEIDNGVPLYEIRLKYDIHSTVLSRLKKQGKLSFQQERPQKRDWKAFEQSFNEHGLDIALQLHDTTIHSVRKAINTGRLSNVLSIKSTTNSSFKHYSKQQLEQAINNSTTYTDTCRQLGVSVCTYNIKRIRQLCKENGIIVEFPTSRSDIDNKSYGRSYSDIFCEDSLISRSSLRPTMIRLNLYTGVCSECSCPDIYNNKPLTLEIDHINGINNDNRLENLRWLCPNCHSQTTTYRRRNK